MRLQVAGLKRQELIDYIHAQFPALEVVDSQPDVIVCYGGDGTLLYAERTHPGVPKILLRNSQVCARCSTLSKETVLPLLQAGKFTIVEHSKLEASAHGETLVALNDIVIAHPHVNGTIRAKVYINGQQYGEGIIGDGVVVCTPIGSTGYYQSITHSHFQSGIGIAFNNTVNIISHLVVNEDTRIAVEILRGPALLGDDNDERQVPLENGERVDIAVSEKKARLIHFAQEYSRFHMTMTTERVPMGFCQICHERYQE